jgi:hypothetical protein
VSARTGGEAYVAPRTPVEVTVAEIWAEVLGLDRVGIHDDFFELGGHSLLATQVVSRARDASGVDIAMRSLFERPTIAGLAQKMMLLDIFVQARQEPRQEGEVGRV